MKTVQIGITLSEEDMARLHERRRKMPKIPPVATLARSLLSSALAAGDSPFPVLSPALVEACRKNIEDQGAIEGQECTQVMAYLDAVLEWQKDKAPAADGGWFGS